MRIGGFVDVDIAVWRDVFDVNIFGAVRITKRFLPAMVLRGAGCILNIASTAGKYGSVNQASYNASKHALVGLTRCLALEAAPAGIRVNAICPGFVNTDIIEDNIDELAAAFALPREQVLPTLLARVPIGRLLEPGEIAELAVYLAAPGSEGMTGQAITLAGGLILI
jgi:NAD(P)-dependent dehydrogenase (short-subunit alcohol dehydrogenase family)